MNYMILRTGISIFIIFPVTSFDKINFLIRKTLKSNLIYTIQLDIYEDIEYDYIDNQQKLIFSAASSLMFLMKKGETLLEYVFK